jgi:hypothetical protein
MLMSYRLQLFQLQQTLEPLNDVSPPAENKAISVALRV